MPTAKRRPQQPPEDEREQAEHMDRLLLRMVALLRDLLRQHVHHPEERDQPDRHDKDDDHREQTAAVSSGLAVAERGVRGQAGKGTQYERQPTSPRGYWLAEQQPVICNLQDGPRYRLHGSMPRDIITLRSYRPRKSCR